MPSSIRWLPSTRISAIVPPATLLAGGAARAGVRDAGTPEGGAPEGVRARAEEGAGAAGACPLADSTELKMTSAEIEHAARRRAAW